MNFATTTGSLATTTGSLATTTRSLATLPMLADPRAQNRATPGVTLLTLMYSHRPYLSLILIVLSVTCCHLEYRSFIVYNLLVTLG